MLTDDGRLHVLTFVEKGTLDTIHCKMYNTFISVSYHFNNNALSNTFHVLYTLLLLLSPSYYCMQSSSYFSLLYIRIIVEIDCQSLLFAYFIQNYYTRVASLYHTNDNDPRSRWRWDDYSCVMSESSCLFLFACAVTRDVIEDLWRFDLHLVLDFRFTPATRSTKYDNIK